MVLRTPLQRLEELPNSTEKSDGLVHKLLGLYATYLERNNFGKKALIERLKKEDSSQKSISEDDQRFTKLMFDLVQELGGGRPLHRHMVV